MRREKYTGIGTLLLSLGLWNVASRQSDPCISQSQPCYEKIPSAKYPIGEGLVIGVAAGMMAYHLRLGARKSK